MSFRRRREWVFVYFPRPFLPAGDLLPFASIITSTAFFHRACNPPPHSGVYLLLCCHSSVLSCLLRWCVFLSGSLTLSWLSISRAAFRTYRSILSNVAGYFKIVWASFISITFSVASSSSRRLKGRTRTATLILSDIFGERVRGVGTFWEGWFWSRVILENEVLRD